MPGRRSLERVKVQALMTLLIDECLFAWSDGARMNSLGQQFDGIYSSGYWYR